MGKKIKPKGNDQIKDKNQDKPSSNNDNKDGKMTAILGFMIHNIPGFDECMKLEKPRWFLRNRIIYFLLKIFRFFRG